MAQITARQKVNLCFLGVLCVFLMCMLTPLNKIEYISAVYIATILLIIGLVTIADQIEEERLNEAQNVNIGPAI